MFLGPVSFLRISQRIHKEINKNTIDKTHAENDIILDVDDDTNI
jgi:hypothetical protein